MSERHIEEAWGLNIPAKSMLVFLALCSRAEDEEDLTSRVTVAQLAWDTGCSETEVQTILRGLRQKNLIQARGDRYWICNENGCKRPRSAGVGSPVAVGK